jgi:kinesin family member 23
MIKLIIINYFPYIDASFRSLIQNLEEENLRLKTENAAVSAVLSQERDRIKSYESNVIRYETTIDALNRKVREKETHIFKLETELDDMQQLLERKTYEKERQKEKFSVKLAKETERKEREVETKFEQRDKRLKAELSEKDAKLKLMREIINDDNETPQVANLIHRFNSNNAENIQPPQSERKARPRVSFK